MILAVPQTTSTAWEYEDFVLDGYKQRLIKPVKNLLSADSVFNSTLRNVLIETNDTVDGFTNTEQLLSERTRCDREALCYHFQFTWLLSIFAKPERNAYLTSTVIDLNVVGRKNSRISIDDFKPTRLNYASFDFSTQMTKWLNDKTGEAIIRLRCSKRCPESMRPILIINAKMLQNLREKRGTRRDEDCSHRQCCLKSRYFQFRNSGYEHIAAPDGLLNNTTMAYNDSFL
ncbi:unnamed protein product [Litomosoides sigmodontis]|uniref:TGF-beta family profile domain-containing protein n=1 Tax=Litomosoides sigmodontis TaxID=42156 RepID=A0A3P6SQS6_LITSI|nr:unnamed protein product [Litomosoides sigmodontis]